MLPIMWRGADNVSRLVFGGFRDLDRRVFGRLDQNDAASAGVEADLLSRTAGQIDEGAAAHVVIHRHDDRTARILHGDADAGAERQVITGGGHAVLAENIAAAGPVAFVMRSVPRRDPSLSRNNGGRQAERHGRCDDPW
jgi:hypothetical protein